MSCSRRPTPPSTSTSPCTASRSCRACRGFFSHPLSSPPRYSHWLPSRWWSGVPRSDSAPIAPATTALPCSEAVTRHYWATRAGCWRQRTMPPTSRIATAVQRWRKPLGRLHVDQQGSRPGNSVSWPTCATPSKGSPNVVESVRGFRTPEHCDPWPRLVGTTIGWRRCSVDTDRVATLAETIRREVHKAVVGQDATLDLLLVGLLSDSVTC